MGDKSGLVFIGLGFELFALVFGGLYLGELVDEHYDVGGYGQLIVLFSCLISWSFHFIFLIRKFMKDAEEFEEKQNDKNK
jgi:hypothetical protein